MDKTFINWSEYEHEKILCESLAWYVHDKVLRETFGGFEW